MKRMGWWWRRRRWGVAAWGKVQLEGEPASHDHSTFVYGRSGCHGLCAPPEVKHAHLGRVWTGRQAGAVSLDS